MKTLIIVVALAASCGSGAENKPEPAKATPSPAPTARPAPTVSPVPQPSATKPAADPAATPPRAAAGSRWATITNEDYGIRLKVPTADRCKSEERGEVGRLQCDYEDFHVVVLAHRGELSLEELRQEAARVAKEIPVSAWRWRGQTRDENGYRVAEAWSASSDGYSIVGLIGQSGNRGVAHVVFLAGDDKAWHAYASEIGEFVDNVEAI